MARNAILEPVIKQTEKELKKYVPPSIANIIVDYLPKGPQLSESARKKIKAEMHKYLRLHIDKEHFLIWHVFKDPPIIFNPTPFRLISLHCSKKARGDTDGRWDDFFEEVFKEEMQYIPFELIRE